MSAVLWNAFLLWPMAFQSAQVNVRRHPEWGAPLPLNPPTEFWRQGRPHGKTDHLCFDLPTPLQNCPWSRCSYRGAAPGWPCVFSALLQCKHAALWGKYNKKALNSRYNPGTALSWLASLQMSGLRGLKRILKEISRNYLWHHRYEWSLGNGQTKKTILKCSNIASYVSQRKLLQSEHAWSDKTDSERG